MSTELREPWIICLTKQPAGYCLCNRRSSSSLLAGGAGGAGWGASRGHLRALQARREGWRSEGIWGEAGHGHGGRFVAQGVSSARAAPSASVSFSCLALSADFHSEAPALQQPHLFSSLSSCLLMCFRHRNFIKAALMSTGFSHGLRR